VVEADDYPYSEKDGACQVKRSKHLDGVQATKHF
jgi:hypothetical protein